jgi:hypothetical protein
MTIAESIALLENLLRKAPPGAAGIWEVFQEWTCHPVECAREELSAAIGYAEGSAYIEFQRTFEAADPSGDEAVVLRLSSGRGDAPRLPEVGASCDDREELAEFLDRVEELPGFTLALAYPHWEFAASRG